MSSQNTKTTKSILSPDDILKLAKLSNLRLSAAEVELYQQEVSSILEMINKLQQIDTSGVEPTYQVSGNSNVMRADKVEDSEVSFGQLLDLAPESADGQIKVAKVL
jgi:aspartyl-tRNA(Asn)/glutamyl-tRNA(Gln) amidotransferase subunit C